MLERDIDQSVGADWLGRRGGCGQRRKGQDQQAAVSREKFLSGRDGKWTDKDLD
jgi:hypothetical protein